MRKLLLYLFIGVLAIYSIVGLQGSVLNGGVYKFVCYNIQDTSYRMNISHDERGLTL